MGEIKLPSRTVLERGLILSIVMAAIGYLGFSIWAGWQDVVSALTQIGSIGIGATLALSLINCGLRFFRWQLYLRSMGHSVKLVPSGLIYFSGFALTTTPGKAGELLRCVFLERYGMPFSRSIAAFVSERLCDVMAILAISLPGMMLYPAAWPVAAICLVGFVILAALLMNTDRLEQAEKWLRQHPSRLCASLRHILRVIIEGKPCYRFPILIIALPVSVLAWTMEAFAFYLLLLWMHNPLPIWTAMSIYALGMFVGGLSFLPGGLGGTEAVMTGLLLLCGLGQAHAFATTLIIRLATLWFAVFLGAITLSVGQKHLVGIRT